MCTLRIHGRDFDVDAYLSAISLEPSSLFRKGEPRRPNSDPGGETNAESGVNIPVSDAEWDDLPAQTRDAERFVVSNAEQLRRAAQLPNVEQFVIDFPIELRIGQNEILAQSDHFPASLVRAAASVGLALELTIYGPMDDSE